MDERYDRQIRLWGIDGQRSLSASHTLVVGVGSVAGEICKNLVLAGANVYLAGEGFVSISDGASFFIGRENLIHSKEADVGLPKVTCMANTISKLNPVVSVEAIESYSLQKFEEIICNVDMVVSCGMTRSYEEQILDLAVSNDIPCLFAHVIGLSGVVKPFFKNHLVLDLHSEPRNYSISLSNPFPGLIQLTRTFLDRLSSGDERIADIPWPLLTLGALEEWRNSGREYPIPEKETDIFIQFLRDKYGGIEDSLEEAVSNVRYISENTTLMNPKDALSILEKTGFEAVKQDKDSPFLLIFNVIRLFYEKFGRFPVSQTLPDMTSSTENYRMLKEVFQRRFEEDVVEIYEFLSEEEKGLLSIEDVRLVCRNIAEVSVFSSESNIGVDAIEKRGREDPKAWYAVFEAVQEFRARHGGEFPGATDHDGDLELLLECLFDSEENGQRTPVADICKEMYENMGDLFQFVIHTLFHRIRYGGRENAPSSALIGGIVSQEVLKLLTHQRKPLKSPLLWNGIFVRGVSLT